MLNSYIALDSILRRFSQLCSQSVNPSSDEDEGANNSDNDNDEDHGQQESNIMNLAMITEFIDTVLRFAHSLSV